MMNSSASLTYRRAAMQQASTVGLVIALYDTLAGDLNRAIQAMDRNDIQDRCTQLSHGFLVLQQLELMLDTKNGGKPAASLQRFYRHIRQQMLQAQFKLSTSILRDQIRIVLEVREAWQKVDGAEFERREMDQSSQASRHVHEDRESRVSFSC